MEQQVPYFNGLILIPPVGPSDDRSWFHRHLGLPDLVVKFQYLCSEFRCYNFGPGSQAFSAELSRIRDDMRKLEHAAYQFDYKRLFSSVVYDYEVYALSCVSQALLNKIVGLHELMFREQQKIMLKINAPRPSVIVPNPGYRSTSSELFNNERIATAGLYSSSSELDTPGRDAGYEQEQQHTPTMSVQKHHNTTTYGRFESGVRFMPYKSTPKRTVAQTMTTFSHDSSWSNSSNRRGACFGIHSAGGCHVCTVIPSQFSNLPKVPQQNANVQAQVFHSIPEYSIPINISTNMGRVNPTSHGIAVTNVTWSKTSPICYPPQQGR